MMPPRLWPTRLWVAAAALALLLAHAIGLAVHLALVEQAGGFPESIRAVNSPAMMIAAENYGVHLITGFVPGLMLLIFGLVAAVPAARGTDAGLASWGRAFLGGLAIVAVVLVALAFPWLRIGW